MRISDWSSDVCSSDLEWATQDQFFTADRIEARIATFSLLTSNNRINWLHLINGKVNLEWEKGGKRNSWTFGDPKRTAQPLDLPIVRSEEHTSELQSLMRISYAVFCLKKKKTTNITKTNTD